MRVSLVRSQYVLGHVETALATSAEEDIVSPRSMWFTLKPQASPYIFRKFYV